MIAIVDSDTGKQQSIRNMLTSSLSTMYPRGQAELVELATCGARLAQLLVLDVTHVSKSA